MGAEEHEGGQIINKRITVIILSDDDGYRFMAPLRHSHSLQERLKVFTAVDEEAQVAALPDADLSALQGKGSVTRQQTRLLAQRQAPAPDPLHRLTPQRICSRRETIV